MTMQAKGTFEVTMSAQPPYDTAPGATLGRVSLSKQFRGDLDASSSAEMLAARTEIPDSTAGYVAIERVVGTLHVAVPAASWLAAQRQHDARPAGVERSQSCAPTRARANSRASQRTDGDHHRRRRALPVT